MAVAFEVLAGFLLVALVAGAELRLHKPTVSHHEAFTAFVQQYGRNYSKGTAEYSHRFGLFSSRLQRAEQHNAKTSQLWLAGTGPLADYTEQELQQQLGWFGVASPTRGHGPKQLRTGMFLAQLEGHEAPKEVLPEEVMNWTKLSSLSRVRNQGGCGSCWAVTSSTVLDAHAEIYKSPQRSFSIQELVSCVPNPRSCGGTGGCEGATVELAMNYALNSAMVDETQDPYTGSDTSCRTKAPLVAAQLTPAGKAQGDLEQPGVHVSLASAGFKSFGMRGWERLPENKAEPLLRAVYERGPVAVSVAADGWDLYVSGIFDSCSKDAVINHAVTLIGYGKDRALDKKFWLIQNSWGHTFGEDGRIRLLRQDNDESEFCGTDSQPKEGTGCDGGPAQVKVCGMCGILYDNVVPHFSA